MTATTALVPSLSVSPFTICSPGPGAQASQFATLATHYSYTCHPLLLHLPPTTLATAPHTTLTLATLATAATARKQQTKN